MSDFKLSLEKQSAACSKYNKRVNKMTLPVGWTNVAIAEISHTFTGSTPSKNEKHLYGGSIPFFKPADLDAGYHVNSFTDSLTEKGAAKARLFPAESVLVTCIGATIGKTGLARVSGATNQQINVLVPHEELADSKFLYWYFTSNDMQEQIKNNASSTTLPILNKSRFNELKLRLPPYPEQTRIVSKIESLQTRSTKTRALLTEVKPLIAQLRQSVLRSAFNGNLTADWRAKQQEASTNGSTQSDGAKHETASELLQRIRVERRERWETAQLDAFEAKGKEPSKGWRGKYKEPEPVTTKELNLLHDQTLPTGWKWAPAELIVDPNADIVYGIVQPGEKLVNGIPYVRGKDIVDGVILIEQLLKTSEIIAAKYERASLLGGDILLGIIRATKVAVVPVSLKGANITQGTARLRPSNIIRTDFLAGWLDSPHAQEWLHAHYRGIDMPGLNLRDVRRLPIPIAPLQEQVKIGTQVDDMLATISTVGESTASMVTVLNQLDQSILSKAFRGELVPQDPNDEPASELLARIHAAREAEATSKNSSKKKTPHRKKRPHHEPY